MFCFMIKLAFRCSLVFQPPYYALLTELKESNAKARPYMQQNTLSANHIKKRTSE